MNTNEYISSGILESYALDQLSEHESKEVERNIEKFPPLKEELERIEETLEALAFSSAINPPESVKNQLTNLLDKENAPVIPISEKNEYQKYLTAASIIIAVIFGLLAYSYHNRWKQAEGRLSELIAQNQQVAENYNLVNQELTSIQQSVAIMNDPSYQQVIMQGTENAPNALAIVYWNKSSQSVFLNIKNLRELSEDQQYQLWAIIDGKPVDAGVFDLTHDYKLTAMNQIASDASAFAVTIEPKGGSVNPSLETMQVIGNV